MASVYDWSIISADNDDADSEINWMEGQFPDTVNNSARAMMKRIAEWIKDQGVLVSAGTANAITVATTNTTITVPPAGMTMSFRALATNTAATTLAINGGGSKPLRKIFAGDTDAVALDAGDITINGIYVVHFDSGANAGAGAWIVVNPTNQTEMQALITTALGGAATKTTPVDADAVVITDSADSGKTKRTLWSNIKATLKSYFDTIYQPLLGFVPIRHQAPTTSTISIGWSGSRLTSQVDATNFGDVWPIGISGNAATATNANAVGGWSQATIADQLNWRVTDTRFAGYVTNFMTIPATGNFDTRVMETNGYVITALWTSIGSRDINVGMRQQQVFIPNIGWKAFGTWS